MKPDSSTLEWLLEKDHPGVRYLTLKNIIKLKADDPQLQAARKQAVSEGMIAQILDHMQAEGYWAKSGPGYSPKYTSTVWSLITLSQLGADINDDARIATACKYYLDQAFSEGGYLGYNGKPSCVIDCLQGNMCAALTMLGVKDERLAQAFDWMARSVTGEGVAPVSDRHAPIRYYSYKCGPCFACGVNGGLPCAWGAVKVMLAFGKLPKEKLTPLIKRAIKVGTEFLLHYDLVLANYPTRNNTPPNRSWRKLGFPVFYVTDVLQNVETLVEHGCADNPKVKQAIAFVLSKKNQEGRWILEYNYNDKTWSNWGESRKPNKWVTYRAYNVLGKI